MYTIFIINLLLVLGSLAPWSEYPVSMNICLHIFTLYTMSHAGAVWCQGVAIQLLPALCSSLPTHRAYPQGIKLLLHLDVLGYPLLLGSLRRARGGRGGGRSSQISPSPPTLNTQCQLTGSDCP